MNCPICKEETKRTETRYDRRNFRSFSYVKIECGNYNCPAMKKTGFNFILTYKQYGNDTVDVISLTYPFERQEHWYMFSQVNNPARFTLYFVEELRRRGTSHGKYYELASIPQDQFHIEPDTIEQDIEPHFQRLMKLKAFL